MGKAAFQSRTADQASLPSILGHIDRPQPRPRGNQRRPLGQENCEDCKRLDCLMLPGRKE